MSPFLAGSLVFSASAAVLVLEILAARLLAPYTGVTIETYTAVIGVCLAGIAVGSWYGGKLADRVTPEKLLGRALTLGGGLALLSGVLVDTIGPGVAGNGPFASVVLATFAFFAPAAVLSSVTPTVAKLRIRDLDSTGSVVGFLSALGTAGALVGTFVTGFILVAALPSRVIVTSVGIALVIAGAVVWWRLDPPLKSGRVGVLVVLVLVGGTLGFAVSPCAFESPYFCGRIVPDPVREGGRTLVLDNLRHSYVDLVDPTHLEFDYTKRFAGLVASHVADGEEISVLHIGGGGFTLPRYWPTEHEVDRNVVLEVDSDLVDVAEQRLGLTPDDEITVRIGDARRLIDDEPTDVYDVVVEDAFGALAVPWHLTTEEMLAKVRRVLTPDGLYLVNLIDYPPLGFAKAETATLLAHFEHVAVLAEQDKLVGDAGGNLVLAASDVPIDVPAAVALTRERGDASVDALEGEELADWIGDARVLRDDFAPVDQLLTPP
ncbi:MAG: fused MFS/spermidine synthase [Actinomycetota bacterium]